MPASEYLAFATDVAAKVMLQSDFAAAGWRTTGFDSGLARKEYLNKVWRQASVVAAGVTGFMVNKLGINIVDDGDVAGFITKLTNALAAQVAVQDQYYADSGSANAIVVATSPVTAALTDGLTFGVRVAANNSGAVTIDCGAGATALRRSDDVALVGGDLRAGQTIMVTYDSIATRFRLISVVPSQFAGAGLAVDGAGALKVDITGQTSKPSPAGTDEIMIYDGAWKKTTADGIAGRATISTDSFKLTLFTGMM